MKTLLTLLLAFGALASSAQDTLISKLPPYDPRMLPAGEALIKAGTQKHVALGCFLMAGFVAGATASNQSRGTFTDRQANGWYLVAGLVGTVGLAFEIGGNGKLIYAGKILSTDWNNDYLY